MHQVTKQRDVSFLALLMILTSWADTGFPYRLAQELPAVGYAPPYGISPQQPAERISMAEVLEGRQEHNQHILNQLKAGKDDAFLLQQIHGGRQERFLHTSSAASGVPQAHRRPSTSSYPTLCHHPKFRETTSH